MNTKQLSNTQKVKEQLLNIPVGDYIDVPILESNIYAVVCWQKIKYTHGVIFRKTNLQNGLIRFKRIK